ncbi:MAG: hypothetical protein SVO26_05445, partial [Chloroflexota bacterium]|nr:hypothetical protein [Chloroflexota bacterium]
MKKRIVAIMLCLALLVSAFPMAVFPTAALADGTTEVHVVKYALDGTTVVDETTVTWEWMRDNMPVYGDGNETHYYYQGPVFEGEWQVVHPGETWNDTPICEGDTIPGTAVTFTNAPSGYCIEYDRWNPQEDTNCGGPEGAVPKDLGAIQGTSINDLCDLVGGLSAGDMVKVKAIDGFNKVFPAEIFMDPPAALGPGVVCWCTTDSSGAPGTQCGVDFSEGMRLTFLADTSTNPWGRHIFGIKDMVENLPSNIWHYYYGGTGDFYPACGGFQVKWISDIEIVTPVYTFNGDVFENSGDPAVGVTVSIDNVTTGGGPWDATMAGNHYTVEIPEVDINAGDMLRITASDATTTGWTDHKIHECDIAAG